MEETVVLTPVVESAPLLLNPLTWIVAFIILGLVYDFFWGKNLEKLSSKFQEPNKTSSTSKPKRARTKSGRYVKDNPKTAKNEAWVGGKAPKKKATKKTPTKKAVKKRTPKKSGK
jgi:FtsZ-interacting cell division protein ZipA